MERYVLTEQVTGKVLLNLPYDTHADKKAAEIASAEATKSAGVTVVGTIQVMKGDTVVDVRFPAETEVGELAIGKQRDQAAADGASAVKPTRKPRSDAGKPRVGKKGDGQIGAGGVGQAAAKKTRSRGEYFVLTDNGEKMAFNRYPSKEVMTQFLSNLSPGTQAKIVQGRELKFTIEHTVTLKPMK